MSTSLVSGITGGSTPGKVLRFGWWNTKISPRRENKSDPRVELGRCKDARPILEELVFGCGLDFLALAEVSPPFLESLRLAFPGSRQMKVLDESLAIGIMYDERRLKMEDWRLMTTVHAGRERRRMLRMVLREQGSVAEILVYLAHWPSRMWEPQAKSERETLARSLSEAIEVERALEDDPLILVMGDFNDEPFDNSMTQCLEASRDRTLVRRRRKLLYNPFWRWLGEQQDGREEARRRRGAGSHFFGGDGFTRWFTFDQALVSAAFLDGNSWRLDEVDTGIIPAVSLTERERPRDGFDHMPIMVTINQVAARPGVT